MSRRFVWSGIGILFFLLLMPAPLGSMFSLIAPAEAQAPDPDDLSQPSAKDVLSVSAVLRDGDGYAEIPERGRHDFYIEIEDHRIEGVGLAGGPVQVQCRATANTTDYRFWSFTQPGIRILTNKGDTAETRFSVFAQSRPTPEIFVLDVRCVGLGSGMQGSVITEFQVGAHVEPYVYMRMRTHPDYPPPTVRPDSDFTHKVILENRGNRDAYFQGRVEAPEGWELAYPESVFVDAGGSKEITITGVAPADKLYYRYDSALLDVSYWPEGEEDRGQNRPIPVSVNGFYLHPALIPLIMLSLLAVVMVAFLLVYARRTVEEQVLGKPIPPWRIPVEKAYLNRLEKGDPDEFYIVRYHLMEEEHQSALLWYKHFKHTTRKDRKLERVWLKKSDRVKGRTKRLRARQERLESRLARRLRVLPARRRRTLASLEKRVVADAWREQRRLLKEHKRAISRISKIHGLRLKQEEKKIFSEHEKERKRIEKQNRKRIKEGEDPLPLPEEPVIERPEPEFPELVEVPLLSVKESRFAKKHERISRSYNRCNAKRSRKAKKRMRTKGARRERKATKWKKKIPKPPSTHLYDEDTYVSEEDIIVEDTRSRLQRVLNIPTLEQQETLRRRRVVYRVKIREAADRNDPENVARLKEEWQEEKSRILQGEGRDGDRKGNPGKGSPENVSQQDDSSEGAGRGRLAFITRRSRRKGPEQEEDEADPAATEDGKSQPGTRS